MSICLETCTPVNEVLREAYCQSMFRTSLRRGFITKFLVESDVMLQFNTKELHVANNQHIFPD